MDERLAVAKANTPYPCAKVELSEMRPEEVSFVLHNLRMLAPA
ncbi:hypothetical protein [Microseira sp. BLCC-F43]|jgi:hypothetical protein